MLCEIAMSALESFVNHIPYVLSIHKRQASLFWMLSPHSKVYQIQAQRDNLEAGRPNTRVIRPLPKQVQYHAVGKRGERYL